MSSISKLVIADISTGVGSVAEVALEIVDYICTW